MVCAINVYTRSDTDHCARSPLDKPPVDTSRDTDYSENVIIIIILFIFFFRTQMYSSDFLSLNGLLPRGLLTELNIEVLSAAGSFMTLRQRVVWGGFTNINFKPSPKPVHVSSLFLCVYIHAFTYKSRD